MKALGCAAALLVALGSNAIAGEEHQLFHKGYWSTVLHVTDEGNMFCETGTSVDKPNGHVEQISLVSSGNGLQIFLYNSALDYEEGKTIVIGLQVDRGPVNEFEFISLGGGSLVSTVGDAYLTSSLETFMKGLRLRTVNVNTNRVVTEYSLKGSYANTLKLVECVRYASNSTVGYGSPSTASSEYY